MEKTLFLLGLIRQADMYGYQINELIDSHFDLIVSITRPTAYRLLSRMAADGWITAREEQFGNRPARNIFSITPQGETAFLQLIRQSMADPSITGSSGVVSLAFILHLPEEERLPLLAERCDRVRRLLERLDDSKQHQREFRLVFEHQRRHFEVELSWMEDLMAQLQAGRSP